MADKKQVDARSAKQKPKSVVKKTATAAKPADATKDGGRPIPSQRTTVALSKRSLLGTVLMWPSRVWAVFFRPIGFKAAKPKTPGSAQASRKADKADAFSKTSQSASKGSPGASDAPTAAAAGTSEQQEFKEMRRALKTLLDSHADTRKVMRHLVFFETALNMQGLAALNNIPIEVLTTALQQFESLVTNWSSRDLSTLRSRMSVAVVTRSKDAADGAHHGFAQPSDFSDAERMTVDEVTHSTFMEIDATYHGRGTEKAPTLDSFHAEFAPTEPFDQDVHESEFLPTQPFDRENELPLLSLNLPVLKTVKSEAEAAKPHAVAASGAPETLGDFTLELMPIK